MLRARSWWERGVGHSSGPRTVEWTVEGVELGPHQDLEKNTRQPKAIDKPIGGSLPISSHAVCWIRRWCGRRSSAALPTARAATAAITTRGLHQWLAGGA